MDARVRPHINNMSKHAENYGRPPVHSVRMFRDEVEDKDIDAVDRTHLTGIITPDFLANPAPLLKPIRNLASITVEDMSVYLFQPAWIIMLADFPATRWNIVQKFLGALYGEAAQTAAACGRPDLNITFFFEGTHRGPKQPAGSYGSDDGEDEDEDEDDKPHVEGTFVDEGIWEGGYNHPLFSQDMRELEIVYQDGEEYQHLIGTYTNGLGGYARENYKYNRGMLQSRRPT